MVSILSFFDAFSGGSKEARFWKWFVKNQEMLFHFERDQETIFDKLSAKMDKVHPDLTFEFSSVRENRKREFVISAGGIRAAFPAVKSLFIQAPMLERWEFVKFRQRCYPLMEVNFGGKAVNPEDVHFNMYKDDDKVGIILFFDGYNEVEEDTYASIGFLLLDEALGEYDIATKVGFAEFHSRESEHFEGASLLSELPGIFDHYWKNKNN